MLGGVFCGSSSQMACSILWQRKPAYVFLSDDVIPEAGDMEADPD